jgi:hypothetical protein
VHPRVSLTLARWRNGQRLARARGFTGREQADVWHHVVLEREADVARVATRERRHVSRGRAADGMRAGHARERRFQVVDEVFVAGAEVKERIFLVEDYVVPERDLVPDLVMRMRNLTDGGNP